MPSRDEILLRLRTSGARAVQSDFKQTAQALDRFGDSADQSRAALARLDRTQDQVRRGSDGLAQSGGRIKSAFRGAGGAVAAAFAGVGVAAGVKTAVEGAVSIEESLSKNVVLFGDQAQGVERFARSAASAFGLSTRSALEATGTFGNLARAMGFSEKEAAAQSVALTQLAADLGSFNNKSADQALEALRSGLVGESEPLRAFGVSLSAAAVSAQALSEGIVKPVKDMAAVRAAQVAQEKAMTKGAEAVKRYGRDSVQARESVVQLESAEKKLAKAMAGQKVELNERQKAQATLSLIFKATEIQQGNFADTVDQLANRTKTLRAEWDNASAALGAALLPALTDAANAASRFIQGMQSGTGAGGQFAQALRDVWSVARPIIGFFKDHPELVAIAAAAWASYRVAAGAAIAATKLKMIRDAFTGMGPAAIAAGSRGGRAYSGGFQSAARSTRAGRAVSMFGGMGAQAGRFGRATGRTFGLAFGVTAGVAAASELNRALTGLLGDDIRRGLENRGRSDDVITGSQSTKVPDNPIEFVPWAIGKLSGSRAMGGPVNVSGAYLVGEHGPEIVGLNRGQRVTNATETRRAAESHSSSGSGRLGTLVVKVVTDGREMGTAVIRREQLQEALA